MDNLPAEVTHVFTEMKAKEAGILEVRRRISVREMALQRHIKAHGALQEHAKEGAIQDKLREDLDLLEAAQKEKLQMAQHIYMVVKRHVNRLDKSVQKLEASGQLAPETLSAADGAGPASGSTRASQGAASAASAAGAAAAHASAPARTATAARLPSMKSHKRRDIASSAPRPALASSANGQDDDRPDDDLEVYCFCQQVSYGEMVACDDANCEREWFHLGCVGLKSPPSGKWYCSVCRERREGRKAR